MANDGPGDHVPRPPWADTIWGRPEAAALNLARLAIFCSVTEHRGFGRAAEDLAVSQPTVSQHIRMLERTFGLPLFHRHGRGAELTEAGKAVYNFAVTMRQEINTLWADLSDLAGGTGGTVALGAGMVTSLYILPVLLSRFYQQYPAAHVRVRVLEPQAVGEEVLHGHVDLGITSEVVSIPKTLKTEPLSTEATILIAPPDHHLASKRNVTLEDLAGEPFLAGPTLSQGEQALDTALRKAGLPPRQVVLELGSQHGVKLAVLEGAGLAVVFQRVAAPELAKGLLVALPVDQAVVHEPFFLLYRRTHRFSPLARKLVTFLRAQTRGVVDWQTPLGAVGHGAVGPVASPMSSSSAPPDLPFSDLSDAEWSEVEPVVSRRGQRGRRAIDDRRVFSGVVWVTMTGKPWAEVPSRFGTPAECRRRFERWRERGVWEAAWTAWLEILRRRAVNGQAKYGNVITSGDAAE